MGYNSQIYICQEVHTIDCKMCKYITLCELPDYLDKWVVICLHMCCGPGTVLLVWTITVVE